MKTLLKGTFGGIMFGLGAGATLFGVAFYSRKLTEPNLKLQREQNDRIEQRLTEQSRAVEGIKGQLTVFNKLVGEILPRLVKKG